MKARWRKSFIRKWVACRYCNRNIYTNETVYKLFGSNNYIICKECYQRHGNGGEHNAATTVTKKVGELTSGRKEVRKNG